MDYKYKFQIITDEWIDIVYLYNNDTINRKYNNEVGIYKFINENNSLEIIWNKWGSEIFKKCIFLENTYYNLKNDSFKIFLENNEWNDIGLFNINNNNITRKYFSSEKGNFNFIDNELIIKWENWGSEKFYPLNYGKIYSNTRFANINKDPSKKELKILAIVFPQFHEIPENNKFWGQGFTEWTLLKNIPRIVNGEIIKKPHGDIGYFNLNDIEHRKYMEILANKYNIYGFCFYHYWFKNKKIMYEPLENMLNDGSPNKPFLFCWANEQWTKKWDGGNDEILLEQDYSDEKGNIDHFNYLLQFFKNKNYIKKFNKPIFIFYRIEEEHILSINKITSLWNNLAKTNGFNGIHFMRFLGPFNNNVKLEDINGFVEFEPGYATSKYYPEVVIPDDNKIFENNDESYNEELYLKKNKDIEKMILKKQISSGYDHYKIISDKEKNIRLSKFFVFDGITLYDKILDLKREYNEQHRGISLQWNNTPRRIFTTDEYSKYPHYYKNISPKLFGKTFNKLLNKINNDPNKELDFIFISAWNEWNEQAILEPNNEDGYSYLHNLNKNYLKFYDKIEKPKILMIGHKGGGTQKYIDDLKELFLNYDFINFENYEECNLNYYNVLYKDFHIIHINSILFNNLKDNYNIFFNVIFENNNALRYLTIHDYQWLFPDNPNILKDDFDSETLHPLEKDIKNFEKLINNLNKIIFPSQNIYKNYCKYINFKNKKNIYIEGHCDKIINYNFLVIPKIDFETKELNIGFIGNFEKYKGCYLLTELAQNIKNYLDYKIIYHIFGNILIEENYCHNIDNISFYNSYKDSEIINILHEKKIHGLVHLSEFEESYCYALTNSINSGIPIFYLEQGAIHERLGKKDKYFPSKKTDIIYNFHNFLRFIIKNNDINNYYELNNEVQPTKWYLTNY